METCLVMFSLLLEVVLVLSAVLDQLAAWNSNPAGR